MGGLPETPLCNGKQLPEIRLPSECYKPLRQKSRDIKGYIWPKNIMSNYFKNCKTGSTCRGVLKRNNRLN